MDDWLKVVLILLAVVILVAWRVRSWIRRERVLREVGLDLHVAPEDDQRD